MSGMKRWMVLVVLAALCTACGEEAGESIPLDEEYGKPVLGETIEVGKGDSMTGSKLLPVSVDSSDTQVWSVRNQWDDTETPEARAAGLAWGENSGLTWDEKYQAWVGSMEPVAATEGYAGYTTFTLTTPYGKSLPAPRLECAETAIFLRATFASWYGLPFIMSAWDNGPVYFGHFGIRTKDGKYGNSPRFKGSYADHSQMSPSAYAAAWPRDSKLRGRKLSANKDDLNGFLCETCYAGAYFDEIFLNKRTGHFMVWLLTYTGSMHLASSDNAFHIEPKAVSQGDVLLERWQKKGIGHTLIVKKVELLEGGHISAELASGSMPRRQPKWEDGASSKSYFTNTYCGGPGSNSSGDEYARLGGGLKRWRHPRIVNGYWHLMIPTEYQDFWIADSEIERIAGRIASFEGLLGSLSPQEKSELLLQKIEEKRLHLRNYPASCSARIEREKAFTELYQLQQQHFGFDKLTVDRQYRIFEDYVFAELEYSMSKTCCWNSTSPAMYEIIMAYNDKLLDDNEMCVDPVVFKATNGGYDLFKEFAVSIGRGAEWVEWSEDESCPQAGTANDQETAHEWTAFCTIAEDVLGGGAGPCDDAFGTNFSSETAAALDPGSYQDLKVCQSTGSDWFRIHTEGASYVVTVTFDNVGTDIDLKLYDAALEEVDSSGGSTGTESVKVPGQPGDYLLEVKLYSGSVAAYSVTVGE